MATTRTTTGLPRRDPTTEILHAGEYEKPGIVIEASLWHTVGTCHIQAWSRAAGANLRKGRDPQVNVQTLRMRASSSRPTGQAARYVSLLWLYDGFADRPSQAMAGRKEVA
jgi:hypothetical protein